MIKYIPTEINLWNSSLVMHFFPPNRTTILKLWGGMDSFRNLFQKMDSQRKFLRLYRPKLKTDTESYTFM